MTELFSSLYLPTAAKAPELTPTFSQVMSSAFNLENDVVNLLDYVSRPTFPADENFNFQNEFASQKLPSDWMPLLSKSTSKPEFDFLLGKVQKEYQDKAVLAAGGWGGTVAALGAGILSPTMFIPFAGQARGAKGFAEILALAAAGAGAQNGALFLNQQTRTEAELYSGIAMDTLLMGMMGGAYLGLSGRARTDLATSIKGNQSFANVPTGPLDSPNGNFTAVQVDSVGDEFSGTLRVLHGYSGKDSFAIEPDYAGPRYEANSFGDKGIYLDETGKWTSNDPYKVMFEVEKVAELDVSFNRALILTPDNATFITKAASNNGGRISGKELSNWARAEGYDGLIVRGFDDLQTNMVGPIPESYDGTPGPISDKLMAFETRVKELGLHEEIGQDQVFSFKTDNLTVNRDGLPPGSKVQPDMARSSGEGAIPTSRATDAQPAGAQVSRSRNTLGAKAAPSRARQAAMDTLGKLSPSYRMLTNKHFPSLRDGIAKLDMSGIQQAGLESVEASARGGTVIERTRGYDYNIVKFAKTLDQNYYRYIHGTDKGFDFDSPAITQIKSKMGKMPNGKLNWEQYKEAVFDGLNTGEGPKEFEDSVGALRDFYESYTTRQKQYLKEFEAQGLEVKPLFKELDEDELGDGVKGYAHHIFSKTKMMENFQEFIDDFAGYNEKQLVESFGKARTRYAKKLAKLEFDKAVSQMDPTTISARLDEVESDLEFLEEIPEWQDFRTKRLEITRQAREEGWAKEMLKEQQKKLIEGLTPDVVALMGERKALMQTAKTLRTFGGDAAEKTAALKEAIAKADGLITDMFRLELPGIQRADLSIGKIQKQSDAALNSVNSDLRKMVKALGQRQAQMSKLLLSKRVNSASRAKVAEQVEAAKLKYAALEDRLSAVLGQKVAFDERLRELQLVREDVIADATRLVRKRAAALEDLEDRLESFAANPLTPEERAKMGAQVEEEIWAHEAKFQQDWAERGERSGDPVTTEAPDFKDHSREMAVMLHQKLMNTEVELSPAYHALRQDARGSELLRVMKIPYSIKNKWLEKDVELGTRAYDRVMAPDLEIWRAFDGSVNAKSLLGEMQDEAIAHINTISTAKYVKLPKGWADKAASFADRVRKTLTDLGEADDIYLGAENFSTTDKEGFVEISTELRNQLNQSVHNAIKASTRDLDVAIQRLRSTRSVPQDAGSLMWRSGKFVKNLNVTTMMGSSLLSSISDVARPTWRYGIQKTLGKGWLPFINKLNPQAKEFRLRSKEINKRIGLNLEPMLHARAQGVFDLAENTIGRTKIERGAAFLANKTGLIAMYDYWTAGMKTIAGNVVHATMAEYVPEVAGAWRKGVEPTGDVLQMRTYLRNMGLTDLDIHRIAAQLEKPGGVETFSNGGVLPNLDKWDDPAAYQAYQAGILKEVNELIVTPGLERPNWVDENMAYSLVAQFKSFTFSSSSRMAMSGLQGNDPYLTQGVAFSLAFGALSYYTYAVSVGGKTLAEANERNADKWLWESVKRSGILGALSFGTDIAGNIPGLNGKESTMFTKPSGLLGVLLGPTYSQAEKVATVITQLNTDDPKQQARNLRNLRQVFIPHQNHFLFRQLFDRVGDALIGG
jgi:hypothetical protein